jgi:hypothetical protein
MKSMMKIMVGAGAVAALAQMSFANGYNYRFHSGNYHQTSEYVDFSAKSPYGNHQAWPKATNGPFGSLRVYYALQLQGAGTGTCYSFEVQGASQPASNTDMVAYMGNTMIDDDGPSKKTPFFKIWVTSGVNFKIAAKDAYNDVADWNLVVNSSMLSKDACKSAYGGTTQPMITSNGEVVVGPNLNN